MMVCYHGWEQLEVLIECNDSGVEKSILLIPPWENLCLSVAIKTV